MIEIKVKIGDVEVEVKIPSSEDALRYRTADVCDVIRETVEKAIEAKKNRF